MTKDQSIPLNVDNSNNNNNNMTVPNNALHIPPTTIWCLLFDNNSKR